MTRSSAWSGLHTRLGAEVIHRREKVDAVILWDMVCGTAGRPCPKLTADASRATRIAGPYRVPPPCVYLLPSTVPDPRNNPKPRTSQLREAHLLAALSRTFKAAGSDVVSVTIEARMSGANLQRRTTFIRGRSKICSSDWTDIRRANR